MILCLVYGLKCIFYAKLLNSFGFNISRYKYKLLTCVGLQIITGKIIVVAEKFLVNTCTYLCLRCAVPYQEEREKKCLRITSITNDIRYTSQTQQFYYGIHGQVNDNMFRRISGHRQFSS